MKILPRTLVDTLCIGILFGVPLVSFVIDKAMPLLPPIQLALYKQTILPTGENPFDQTFIKAEAAYVWDIKDHKVLFSKNATIPLPLASITKVMTSLVALESAPQDTKLTFDKSSLAPEGDSGLMVGEIWKLKNLIDFTLVESSNDGAQAVASAIEALNPSTGTFVSRMNSKAHALGLSSMSFENPTGLDVTTTEAGGYGSAQDVALLYEYVLRNHPELFDATTKEHLSVSSDQYTHTATNTNIVVNELPGIVGSKTGFSDLAGGNLAVLLDVGIQHPVAIVVLGSTEEERFSDIQTLSSSTLHYFQFEK